MVNKNNFGNVKDVWYKEIQEHKEKFKNTKVDRYPGHWPSESYTDMSILSEEKYNKISTSSTFEWDISYILHIIYR